MPTTTASRFARTVAAGLFTLAIVAAPAAAQRSAGYAGAAVRPATSSMDMIGRSIDRGFQLAGQGKYDAARLEFRAAAERQQRAGYLPETSLWQIASTYYAQSNFADAARTLDELAVVARSHGDRQVQAKALLEAAFLYRRAGDVEQSTIAARQLKQVVRAGGVSAELKSEIERRVGA